MKSLLYLFNRNRELRRVKAVCIDSMFCQLMQTKFPELVQSGQLGFVRKIFLPIQPWMKFFEPLWTKLLIFFAVKEHVQQGVEKLCKLGVLELCMYQF